MIKHKGRYLLVVLIICILNYNKLNKPVDNYKLMPYTVNNGQTLWNIAADYTDSGEDIRKTVYEIRQINDITPVVHEGQTILIPVKGEN